MSKLPLKKNFGDSVKENPRLARQLDEMYTDIANQCQTFIKRTIITGSNPPANNQSNSFFNIGDVIIRSDTNAVWMLTSRTTPDAVTWTLLS